ncbi:Ankyrin repeat-containing protein 6 [Elsinoe fawcettii]|nr:Ankyrin repeat-containing protein 6 [Elsinoe fawcettii]
MADEGASPRELLLESCRRNNASLLTSVLSTFRSPDAVAHFLNTSTDGLGCSALHIAAQYGSYDVLDVLLDQEGVEIDGQEKREGDTCLHKAVRWVNEQGREAWEEDGRVVEILLDAGCDPRIRNKAKLKPFDLVDPRNGELRKALQKAEFTIAAGDDVVQDDSDDGGPASDSD